MHPNATVAVQEVSEIDSHAGGSDPNVVYAVNKVSFGIPAGQTFGLLGPNGAGKSTTLNLITGDLKFDKEMSKGT